MTPPEGLWQETETLIATALQAKGYYVINFNTNRGNAPVHRGDGDVLITPDLDVMKGGVHRFAEVKRKSIASWSTIRHIYAHGIGKRLYQHYRNIELESGSAVWLFVHQVDIGEVLYAKFAGWLATDPGMYYYNGDLQDKGGMVFWPVKSFHHVKLDEFIKGNFPDELLIAPYGPSGQTELFSI